MAQIDRNIVQRVEKLRRELHRHDYLYYVLAQPEISDEQYDEMMRELQDVEAQFPQLVTPDSPTQRVGGQPTKTFPTVTHDVPMLSLSNTYSEDEIRDFDRRVRSLLSGQRYSYVCELKYDGVSLRLRYENGVLVLGATRGDGVRGDNITANVRTIRSIPLRLNTKETQLLDCEVRGEVIMNRTDFLRMNEERERVGERMFVNPRNSVAGTLKLQDPKIVATRPLRFFAYALQSERTELSSHYESLKTLRRLGFPTDENAVRCGDIDAVIKRWREWEAKRESLPFDIDGIVVKIDSLRHREILGTIAKSPRWAIACKFAARKAETMLADIRFQVGRIGTITPVAVLEPVFIGGTTVSRASLYNEDYINELGVDVGDVVTVERGGDVIPKITSVVRKKDPKHPTVFKFPTKCPECGTKLVRLEGESNYYCENASCPKQVRERIEHWASRSAMDIARLGEAVVDQLVEHGFVKTVADLYELHTHREKLIALERWGEKSVSNLLEGIEQSKERPYHRVLYGLGIRHVGEGIAQALVDRFSSVDELMRATSEELMTADKVGPKIAESIVRFFEIEVNRKLIERLQKNDLHFEAARKQAKGTLAGKTFVLTGSLTSMTREQAKRMIEQHGGRVASSVSKNVNVLVVGEEAGSKLDKAKKLGIDLWDEDKLMSMLKRAR